MRMWVKFEFDLMNFHPLQFIYFIDACFKFTALAFSNKIILFYFSLLQPSNTLALYHIKCMSDIRDFSHNILLYLREQGEWVSERQKGLLRSSRKHDFASIQLIIKFRDVPCRLVIYAVILGGTKILIFRLFGMRQQQQHS